MELYGNLETKAAEIAEKTGLAVADVHAIANTFQANLTSSDGNPEQAIEAAAPNMEWPQEPFVRSCRERANSRAR